MVSIWWVTRALRTATPPTPAVTHTTRRIHVTPSQGRPYSRAAEAASCAGEEGESEESMGEKGPADEEEEKANQIDKQLEELNEELKALQMKEHHTTGHVRDRSARMSPCRPHTIPALVAGVMWADRTVAATGFHRLPV